MGGPWLAGDASAADPIKVTITSGGPDRAYPLGQEFRVEGKPAKVPEQVDLVIVRAAQTILGVGDPSGKTCSDVKERILDGKGNVREFERNAPVGATRFDALWGTVDKGINELSAYRASPWKRESEKDTTYSLFVPNDSMFMPGASYCVFLLQTDKSPLVMKGILEAVTKFAEGWGVCDGAPSPNDCTTVSNTYDQAIKDALEASNLDAKGKADVQKQLDGLRSALDTVRLTYKRWGEFVTHWDRAVYKRGDSKGVKRPNLIDIQVDLSEDPPASLPKLIADLLVAHGELVAVPTKVKLPAKGTEREVWRVQYLAPEGMRPITHITIDGDGEVIRVRNASDSKAPTALKTKTSGLSLPGSKITLRDLLELSLGKLKFGSQYLTLSEGQMKELNTVLDKSGLNISTKKLETTVDPFLDWLGELDLAVTRAWQAGAPVAEPVPFVLTWTPLYASLGAWLKEAVLNPCDKFKVLPKGLDLGSCVPDQGKPTEAAWPGFQDNRKNPIWSLRDSLNNLRNSAVQAQTYKTDLEGRTQLSSTKLASTINVANRIDRNAWFGQHVVTTVGVANVINSAAPLWVNYYGFKLYFWANPVDQPRWVGSPMWYRNLSLEFAIVPNLDTFGSSGRYQGLSKGDIPPLMVGAAIQPVPYITLSAGAIFMESRQTVLPQERASTFISPYVAFAADLNLLDFVAAALSQGRTTTISALVKP
ncbi:hypothetical protein [Polyangium mundeleinium]|uniref:Uncharacterized protein n=1 Tax=Polyangium mundeleinium TaxID=2995306 RepID=A0ABT5F4K2_9BACT|nr:hypothetical protein [Polyangium mundeleinium]MDC0748921.1 hypothetical protein [Polyangium mundeleinium]